jgi:DNA modification methylase
MIFARHRAFAAAQSPLIQFGQGYYTFVVIETGKMQMAIRSPKLTKAEIREEHTWYPYYAGYSVGFVEDTLSHLNLSAHSTVLDPWNGSGTTTFAARKRAYTAVGFDLNPALVLVAKGRLLDGNVLPSLPALTSDIIKKARDQRKRPSLASPEPLTRWFVDKTAADFRAIDQAVSELMISADHYEPLFACKQLSNVSSLAAFFYVALFETVRSFLGSFKTTNPTWIKSAKSPESRLEINRRIVTTRFQESVGRLSNYIAQNGGTEWQDGDYCRIEPATSEALPIQSNAVDAVLGSPPYCTRIDYAIATLPELSILGCGDKHDLKKFRDTMIGTPTIRSAFDKMLPEWGQTCSRFLKNVQSHSSKASDTYYSKYFIQYFSSLWNSLAELDRVLRPGAPCALVVQDSYYKEVHNDLPRIVSEMARSRGWELQDRMNYKVISTKASMHESSRRYRSDFKATESLLIFHH